MKFFKRRLLRGTSWGEAIKSYNDYLEKLSGRAPEGLMRLADLNLHDWRIEKVSLLNSELILDIEGHLLKFSGVSTLYLAPQPSGDSWLYSEVDREGSLCVLRVLTSSGELLVNFRSMTYRDKDGRERFSI